jgi:hypothetical protein
MPLSVFVALDGSLLAFQDIDRAELAPDDCVISRAVASGQARVGCVPRTPCESVGSPEYKRRVAAAFPALSLAESMADLPYDCWWWQV